MWKRNVSVAGVAILGLLAPAGSEAAAIVFEASGANAAAIQATVDAFRTTLGNPNNGNTPGPLAGGRREINWDGGGATTTAVAGASFAGFQGIRGALFTTPGTGFAQAPLVETAGPADQTLSELLGNATYATAFSTFSPVRVFTPLGSNITDATFFVPGVLTPAGVSAFGVVFSDVDIFGPTKIEFFGPGDVPLFSRSVLAGTAANGGQSFLGVSFNAGEVITRARITTGTGALGPDDNPGGGVDMVVMDDLIYSEPKAVPEPITMALLGMGLLAAARRRSSR
jgi:PEP-CTERM motif